MRNSAKSKVSKSDHTVRVVINLIYIVFSNSFNEVEYNYAVSIETHWNTQILYT